MNKPAFLAFAFLSFCLGPTEAAPAASAEKSPFGKTRDGKDVEMFTLRNSNGLVAKVISYGAILYSFEAPDKQGRMANLTIPRETVADYERKSAAFGAVVGRFANRIGGARFTLDGKGYELTRNAGRNHIHGGARGFDKQVWQGTIVEKQDGAAVQFVYVSKDGEEGYPGTLRAQVEYELNNDNELKLTYEATTDKPTHINLSNHAYWNLGGIYSGDVLGHVLTVNADKYLLADEGLVPTGEYADVQGTPLDFRKPMRVGERIRDIEEKQFNGGYDHCFVLNKSRPGELSFCATLKHPKSGRAMTVHTTEPGVQVFSANFGPGAFEGANGYEYPRHLGLCLETQHFPDSPNKPHFPSTVLRPGQVFRSTTVHRFSVEP